MGAIFLFLTSCLLTFSISVFGGSETIALLNSREFGKYLDCIFQDSVFSRDFNSEEIIGKQKVEIVTDVNKKDMKSFFYSSDHGIMYKGDRHRIEQLTFYLDSERFDDDALRICVQFYFFKGRLSRYEQGEVRFCEVLDCSPAILKFFLTKFDKEIKLNVVKKEVVEVEPISHFQLADDV